MNICFRMLLFLVILLCLQLTIKLRSGRGQKQLLRAFDFYFYEINLQSKQLDYVQNQVIATKCLAHATPTPKLSWY